MTRARVNQLRAERAKLVADARAVLDTADKAKRGMTQEEDAKWSAIMADVDKKGAMIGHLERQMRAEPASKPRPKPAPAPRKPGDIPPARRGAPPARGPQPIRMKRLPRRHNEQEYEYRSRCRRATPEYRAAYNAYLVDGLRGIRGLHARAISADTDIVGGYLVAPQEFTGTLIKFVDNLVFIRQKATKYTVQSAQSLGAPSLDTDPADSDWTSELATGNEDTSMAFGKRELTPHPLAKRIKVSNKLLRMATISGTFSEGDAGAVGSGAESLVRARLGYKFAVTEEKGFMTGNGAQQPLGLFTASSRGISTARDIVTGLTTGFTADCFFDVKYSLKQQYQERAEWLFNRTAMPLIRKLKDGIGQYIWQPGLVAGQPDALLDRPVNVSEYVPNTFTTGQYVGMFADFSFYWIADAENMVIQRLDELYAEANQVGFIARMELDGMPVLEEAFARIKTS